MFNAKFDFDAAFDRATELLSTFGLSGRVDLHKCLMRREAAVVRMANSKFWSDEWHAAAKAITVEDEKLARFGLV